MKSKRGDILVLQVISTPNGGGAETLVRKIGKKIGNYGFISEVIYFNHGLQEVQLHPNELMLKTNVRSPFAILKLRNIFRYKLKSNRLIIHVHLTWPFFYVALASLGLPVQLVFTEHSTFNRRRNIPFWKYIERVFYARYCKIICISEGTRNSLCEWIGTNSSRCTQTIPNGAYLYNLKERSSLFKVINFVSIGSLTVRKNFKMSLQSLALLKRTNWTYTVVGEGPERSKLSDLAIKLGIQDKVNFIGWSNEIEKHLHQADIQLIPSLWEGFGLVAAEGMSTGLPVVASNVDGLREVLGQDNPSVFLVDEITDPQRWAEKIEECIVNVKQCGPVLAQAARRQAEQFTLDKMISRYAEVYKRLF